VSLTATLSIYKVQTPTSGATEAVTFALQLLIQMLEEVVAIPEPEASERFLSFVLISHFYPPRLPV
jgi:hypothetical protein